MPRAILPRARIAQLMRTATGATAQNPGHATQSPVQGGASTHTKLLKVTHSNCHHISNCDRQWLPTGDVHIALAEAPRQACAHALGPVHQ
eukprot:9211595-Alexandrium_andersonii.AAC.1